MKVIFLFLPFLFLMAEPLQPGNPLLPNQEGAGTFGALVDGVVWRPNNGGQFFPLVLGASYSGLPRGLIIYAVNRETDESFYFGLEDTIYSVGTYLLASNIYEGFYVKYEKEDIRYFPNADNYGTLVITKLDTLNIGFVSAP
ncbi:MAG: hypothetical protein R3C61_13355 [Bacteroidia bacterium]